MSKKKNKLIVILGPTASGKSSLAVKLAKKFDGEIISADSRQIYRGMDIGTGKIIKDEMKGIKHYLLNVVDPDEEFTLAHYKDEAIQIINKIHRSNKTPFLVGGTGLYIQSIVDNLDIPRVPPDIKLRKKIEKEIEMQGLQKVYIKLLKLDPESKNIIDLNNPRKIIRALEVCLKTKKPFSSFYKKGPSLFDILQIGIKVDRDELYKTIDKRVDMMISEGLVKEVEVLLKNYSWDLSSMSGIGYKEIGDYLKGSHSLNEAAQKIKYRTHSYARRQITWFKRDKRIKWAMNYKEIEILVKNFFK